MASMTWLVVAVPLKRITIACGSVWRRRLSSSMPVVLLRRTSESTRSARFF